MESEDRAIQEFCSITASSRERARFFLDSCGWHVLTAVQNYYEADGGLGGDGGEGGGEGGVGSQRDTHSFDNSPDSAPSPSLAHSSRAPPVQGVGRFEAAPKPSSRDKKAATAGGSSGRSGGIRTLSDFNRRSDSDSDDDTQEYYTGGEKSGMMVQDPQKGNRVDAIFEQARRMGAQEGPSEPPQTRPGRSTFTGVGRTLTGEPTHPVLPGAALRQPSQQPDPIIRNITFWRNGFTVDDGPLRRIDDPANAQFLTSIGKSECPKELEPAERGTPVHVNLVRRDGDWKPPPEPKQAAFQGVGRTLGSASAATTTDSESASFVQSPNVGSSQGLIIDESLPVTSIQLRLSDGTRMVARFNHNQTIADIRRFIDAARPGGSRNYQLQTMGFPPKVLSDNTLTIDAAGLANAVVIQKT